jgi:hypothetical protein
MVEDGCFRLLYPPGKRKKPSFNCGDFQQCGQIADGRPDKATPPSDNLLGFNKD